ncbi:MAG: hypothetical protein Kow0090_09830 [Myxococcota bacterium]
MKPKLLSLILATAFLLSVGYFGCGGDDEKPSSRKPTNQNPSDETEEEAKLLPIEIDEAGISAVISGKEVKLSIPLFTKTKSKVSGELKLRLDPILQTGEKGKESSIDFTIEGGAKTITATAEIDKTTLAPGETANYIINLDAVVKNYKPKSYKRSLFDAVKISEAVLLSTDTFIAGGKSYLRAMVRDPKTGNPVKGAKVTAKINIPTVEIYGIGITDDFGVAPVLIEISESIGSQSAVMAMTVENGDESQYVEKPVQILRNQRVLLTTDKPLYQPGQTMHLRALALRYPNLAPEAEKECLFEVMDAKGNKVFKKRINTNKYGIASTTFKLAREVNMGAFSIKATVGDTVSEKTVTVEKYKLPKFKVELTADKAFYKPGDVVALNIKAYYFFGKALANASYTITAQQYDTSLSTFSQLDGKLDKDGLATVKVELPKKFYGDPFHQGNAFVLFNLTVLDTANQKVEASKQFPVVESAILPFMFCENDYVANGIPNRFFILASDPNGQPVEADVSLKISGKEDIELKTDKFGVAIVEITPTENETALNVNVVAQTAAGESAERNFEFSATGAGTPAIRVRTDKAFYSVGETLQAEFFASGGRTGRVFLDIIKNAQTILTMGLDLDGGRASALVDITPDMSGTLQLFAYYITELGDLIRDTALIQISDANDLNISVKADKEIYLPAEDATINFEITDAEKSPVAAALGIQIVDEAVYALMENKPGLEKIFFQLEKEILEPRYQIKGFSQEELLDDDPASEERRERAAEVLMAAAGGEVNYGINENTYHAAQEIAKNKIVERVQKDFDEIAANIQLIWEQGQITEKNFEKWFSEHANDYLDPFGNAYTLSVVCRYEGSSCKYEYDNNFDGKISEDEVYVDIWDYEMTLYCLGADELKDTKDDIALNKDLWAVAKGNEPAFGNDDDEAVDDGDWADAGGERDDDDDALPPGENGEPSGGGGGGEEKPRVRKYFPETLYVNPSLITDESGRAQIKVKMADSITAWRMTTMASSLKGQLGSTATAITVFQDFFVDIDFPVALTQDDEVSVPVIVYNYLAEPQNVNLIVEEADWFTLLDASSKMIPLEPNQVTSVYFRVRVDKVGFHSFTVYGMGSKQSDAVARSVEVIPNGTPIYTTFSGTLKDEVEHTVSFPPDAIEGANKLQIKVYPGLLSQVVEGLDSMLQMPSGCFEQTSSSTYPNVLVLDYLRQTGTLSPEIEVKALDYIAQGYQRLLTFEVDGGGFEWFGNQPAHIILTAFGIMEFNDMSKVYEVDPAVIERTQTWLANKQQGDGSFHPQSGGYFDGAINSYTDSVLRNSAYVTWALVESGYKGYQTNAAIAYLENHYKEAKDNYTLAVIANAFVSYNPNHTVAKAVLDELNERKIVDGDKIYWDQDAATESYSYGASAGLETTAMIAYAMIRSGAYFETAQGVLNYLAASKDQFGNWSNTQATIYALRSFIASLKNQSQPANATVKVFHNESLIQTYDITDDTSDVFRQIDLAASELQAENNLKLTISGEGTFMYQIVGTHFIPWQAVEEPTGDALAITVDYDKTNLAVDDEVEVTVTVTNNIPDSKPGMILVDLGIPPGFDVVSSDLDKVIEENPVVTKYELTGRQILVYIAQVNFGEPVVFSYHLTARFPVNAQTPSSKVYAYYTPEDSSTAEPEIIVVE